MKQSEEMVSSNEGRFGGRRRRMAATAVGVAVLLAGCAENAPQDTFQPEGSNARSIDGLQRELFYISGVVGVLVFAAVGYAIWKFKDRGQDIPEQSHGNPKLEILLTILPAVILAVVAVPSVVQIFELADQENDCVINVTGQQWWWEYDYVKGSDLRLRRDHRFHRHQR
jgi:cytochrome c oxidase subunit 2